MSRVLRKPAFCICKNKDGDQLRGNREADQRLGFPTRIVQFLVYLYPKFQASSHLLWLYSPVCVGPGRKPRRPVFSERGSYSLFLVIFILFPFSFSKIFSAFTPKIFAVYIYKCKTTIVSIFSFLFVFVF